MKKFLSIVAVGLAAMCAAEGRAADAHFAVRGVHVDVGNPHGRHYGYRNSGYGRFGQAGGYYGRGYGSYYRGNYGGGGRAGHGHWHDTSHYDYHPGGLVPHYDHYDYVPGHWDYHQEGHWDHH